MQPFLWGSLRLRLGPSASAVAFFSLIVRFSLFLCHSSRRLHRSFFFVWRYHSLQLWPSKTSWTAAWDQHIISLVCFSYSSSLPYVYWFDFDVFFCCSGLPFHSAVILLHLPRSGCLSDCSFAVLFHLVAALSFYLAVALIDWVINCCALLSILLGSAEAALHTHILFLTFDLAAVLMLCWSFVCWFIFASCFCLVVASSLLHLRFSYHFHCLALLLPLAVIRQARLWFELGLFPIAMLPCLQVWCFIEAFLLSWAAWSCFYMSSMLVFLAVLGFDFFISLSCNFTQYMDWFLGNTCICSSAESRWSLLVWWEISRVDGGRF